ncbi:MAG: Bifunctional IPC transferase and DIPP synthase [Candidatus Scalindua rubra]|uniref:Bifunctional IPC transferase and DIPP synthase n=1 Tax=Candidatus Scalindua rubra TaxID=1872076 RepID=A0A1E3X7H6_9BACT|nr:MAG: Bifunctional IPC transferase and DIPP synthase [Candidatus Scalindua rubra]
MINKAFILIPNYKSYKWAFSEIAHVSLLKRAIFSGQKAGINEFFILISGKNKSEIERSLSMDKRIRAEINIIDFLERTEEEVFTDIVSNLSQNYLIIKANTVFDNRLLQEFSQFNLKDAMAAISVYKDKNISPKKEFTQYRAENHPFSPPLQGGERGEVIKSNKAELSSRRIPLDIEQLHKKHGEWYVKLSDNNELLAISQMLENYDGRAAGMVLASPKIIEILIENLSRDTSFSLYKLMELQVKDGNILAFDVKDNLCMEVISNLQLKECERKLYNSLGASVDGPIVDKYINRKISRLITEQLVKTPITPNQTTFLSLMIGIVSAWFFWQGGYWNYLAGGLVFQLSFIFDQCDGEIARLKFMESKIGGWFDAFCDSIIRTFIILGMTGSLYAESNQSLVLILGIISSIGIFVSTMAGSYETFKKEESIDYTNKESTDASIEKGNKLSAFIDKFNNTDSFSIIIFICILSGQLVWFLWTIGIGSFGFTLVILVKSLISKLAHVGR